MSCFIQHEKNALRLLQILPVVKAKGAEKSATLASSSVNY